MGTAGNARHLSCDNVDNFYDDASPASPRVCDGTLDLLFKEKDDDNYDDTNHRDTDDDMYHRRRWGQ